MARQTLQAPIGTDVPRVKSIISTRRLSAIDSISFTAQGDVDVNHLDTVLINREGAELLRGRCYKPKDRSGVAGRSKQFTALGWQSELNRFITGSGTITNKTIPEALQEILDESPSTHGITLGDVDTFHLSKAPWEYTTSTIEFLKYAYASTGIEFDIDGTLEVDEGKPDGANVRCLPYGNIRCCFVDSVGRIFVIYTDNGGANLYYTSSVDGTTWAAPTGPLGLLTSNVRFDAVYHRGQERLYFINYNGAISAIYKCTIAGAVITFTIQSFGIYGGAPGWPICSTIWDSDGDLWTIGSNGDVFESVDDGVNVVNRFTPTETAKLVFPKRTLGDLFIIEYDAGNDHLELWEFIENGDTEQLVKQIKDMSGDALDSITGALDHYGNIHLIVTNSADAFYIRIDTAEALTEIKLSAGPVGFEPTLLTIFVDNVAAAYPIHSAGYGARMHKILDGVNQGYRTDVGAISLNVQSPFKGRVGCNMQTGFSLAGGENGAADEIFFYLQPPEKIQLSQGHTSGSFTSDTKSGDGDFSRWGFLWALMTLPSGITWKILKAADDSELASINHLSADLHDEGVPSTETDIKIKPELVTVSGVSPSINAYYLSERWTKIESLPYSYEPIGDWIKKLELYTGGESDLNSDNTLDFVTALGVDKSSTIILEEGVNITQGGLEVDQDATGFANCIVVIGSGVTAEVKSNAEITEHGEYWARSITDTDITTKGMAFNRGWEALVKLRAIPQRITAPFLDKFDTGQIDRGDTVAVKSGRLNLDTTARIYYITRNWGTGGEKATAILANSKSSEGLVDYWAELEDVRRQLV